MHSPHRIRTLPLVVALAFGSALTVAQAANGTAGAGPSSQTAEANPSAAAQQHAATHKLSHGDRKFMEDAAKGGMFEVQTGKLAEQKASDPAVKEFAQRLVQDHSKGNDELKQIADAKGVQLPSKDKWSDRHEEKKLDKLSGKDFDREFAQHSVKDHEKDIKKFEKAAAKLQDPDVKAWAEKQLPVLREHLAMAQKLPEAGNKSAASGSYNSSNPKAAGNRSAS